MTGLGVTRCGALLVSLMLAGCVPDLANQCAGNGDCPAARPVCVAGVCVGDAGAAAPETVGADADVWNPFGADRLTGEADAAVPDADLSIGAAPDAGSAAPGAASPPPDPPTPPEAKDGKEKGDAGGHHHGPGHHDHGDEGDD